MPGAGLAKKAAMTNLTLLYSLATLWGLLFGLVYFGGLWLTIRRLPITQQPALWMLSSFLLRNLLAVAAFYPVVINGWLTALFSITGFIGARLFLQSKISAAIKMHDGGKKR
jgi:F1F0 ATPase subunit 2